MITDLTTRNTSNELILSHENINNLINSNIQTQKNSSSKNTQKMYEVYQDKFNQFISSNGFNVSNGTALLFVQSQIEKGLKYATIRLIVSACKKLTFKNQTGEIIVNPFYHEAIANTLKGLKNLKLELQHTQGIELEKPKKALTSNIVDDILESYEQQAKQAIQSFIADNPKQAPKRIDKRNTRNKFDATVDFMNLTLNRNLCLISMAYETGLRSSDLLSIQMNHLKENKDHILIKLTESKTDTRRNKVILKTTKAYTFLVQWLKISKITTGFIFKHIAKNGLIKETKSEKKLDKSTKKLVSTDNQILNRMSYQAYLDLVKRVVDIVKNREQQNHDAIISTSIDKTEFATHSLRRGRITDLLSTLSLERVSGLFHANSNLTQQKYNENKSDEYQVFIDFYAIKNNQ